MKRLPARVAAGRPDLAVGDGEGGVRAVAQAPVEETLQMCT